MHQQAKHQKQLITSPYSMPATAYLALAQQQHGEEHEALLFLAAGRLIQDGDLHQAEVILSQISATSPAATDQKKILLAKISRARQQPHAILKQLALMHDVTQLPSYYQAQYHEMLAYAYLTLNNPVDSVAERIKLEQILPDDLSRSNNRRALWLALINLPSAELDTLAIEAPTQSVMQGWMKLALISRRYSDEPSRLIHQLTTWQHEYPHHPGNALLPSSLENDAAKLHAPPRRIALLLPLSGLLSGPGNAVKDGFLAAFEHSPMAAYTQIKFYDTQNKAVADLYQQAITEGAQYVIGPLTKTDTDIIAHYPLPVPTVLLNDVHTSLHDNGYQFGLSPTLEARQVAAQARKNGHSNALIVAPEGAWGDAIARAFGEQWLAVDGHITEVFRYKAQGDMHETVRSLLHISASELREDRIKKLLGSGIETTPMRRTDFDMIFLVAYPSTARQIKPLLNYYYAGEIPVYATSSVYAGSPNTIKDRDLNGIIFPDLPWVFSHQLANKNWPEAWNSYNRLFALGMDSFALSTQLNQLVLFPAIKSPNGTLYLSANQQIARILSFAQFKDGIPVPMI